MCQSLLSSSKSLSAISTTLGYDPAWTKVNANALCMRVYACTCVRVCVCKAMCARVCLMAGSCFVSDTVDPMRAIQVNFCPPEVARRVKNCPSCAKAFGMLQRKHHCRFVVRACVCASSLSLSRPLSLSLDLSLSLSRPLCSWLRSVMSACAWFFPPISRADCVGGFIVSDACSGALRFVRSWLCGELCLYASAAFTAAAEHVPGSTCSAFSWRCLGWPRLRLQIFRTADGTPKVDILHPEYERNGSTTVVGCEQCLKALEKATKLERRLQSSASRLLSDGAEVRPETLAFLKTVPPAPAFEQVCCCVFVCT